MTSDQTAFQNSSAFYSNSVNFFHCITSSRIVSHVSILLVGGAITLALFVFMAQLIKSDDVYVEEVQPSPIIDYFERPAEPSKPIKKIRLEKKSIPPLVKRDTVATTSSDTNNTFDDISPEMTTPIQETFTPGFNEGDAMPVVQVSPQYPMDAARDGKEGYVIVMFDISSSGAVINAQVLEAEPKRTFNRAALQAINNWKYKPKTVKGQGVIQHNQQVRLDFTLDHSQ
ncbi:energy transducer TonB [Shewanella japonica]|uniref:energy transducer TonB n=1 Tax=Shewanella japonica TaxID=93973 RepID=UPI00249400AC|nr:energy transducer TonB [Shewanella japonica]